MNCTRTGGQQQIRSFCAALREWDSQLFGPVDFKITDGLQKKEAFKRLTIRKTEELVGYGLGQAQPQLATSKATHRDAIEYHKALEDPDAIVVVDVRREINRCKRARAESRAARRMRPPANGANVSRPEGPQLGARDPGAGSTRRETRAARGARVLMYCTGGIRCERASALLSELSSSCEMACPSASDAGRRRCSGPQRDCDGARRAHERYLRTFPDGGYWAGANYLFDRRFEQRPLKRQAPRALRFMWCPLRFVPR